MQPVPGVPIHAQGLQGWMAAALMQVGRGLSAPSSGSWPDQKKSALGSPFAKQELLGGLGVRRRPGYHGGRAPRTLLLCRALLPTAVWLGSMLGFTHPFL